MSTPRLSRRAARTATSLLLGALLVAPALGEASVLEGARLGKVDFKVECSAGAQARFNHAMALYHSFAWKEAQAAFAAVAQADPGCGMAHWGRAMVMLANPFTWPGSLPPAKLDEVAAALADARAAGLATERERGYVEAVETFVGDHDRLDHRTRLLAFEAAMVELAARYPDDMEASILAALVTSANFDPTDKSYTNQLRAARILEPLFASQPDHPGVAHYLIHSYDYPPIAHRGLEAARRYAEIAPDAPHALHMPAHIFTRLGHWRESIEANRASAAAAGDATFDGHHAADYLVYARLQLGQARAARRALEESLAKKPIDHFGAAYAYAAMPARLALEAGAWQEAARLPLVPEPGSYPWEKYPQAEAVNAFARGIGAAMSGDAAAARAELARLEALGEAAAALKIGYWVEQIAIEAEVVRGLALRAEGDLDDAVRVLRAVAAREDATEKHVVTPGPLLPARELLADLLLDAVRFAEALSEYEAVLAKEPNRYRAVLGAARAAQGTGDAERARAHFAHLLELGEEADPGRKELADARAFLAKD